MIITTISAATVRIILRVYFLFVIASTGWIAKKLLHSRTKIRVAKDDSLPATHAIGSVDGFSLVTTAYKLRSLPGGFSGFSFLLALFVLGKAADLLTSYLVVSQQIHSRCIFSQGLIFNDSKPNTFSQYNGRPVLVLQNSQIFAVNNSCQYGIYKKVNFDFSFCPDASDTLGSWQCVPSTNELSFPSGTGTATISSYLHNNNLLYSNSYSEGSYSGTTLNNHLVYWSSSAQRDSDGSVWSVLAAVQTNSEYNDPIQMETVNCTLDAAGATNTMKHMASLTALSGWLPTFLGLMYWGTNTDAVSDVGDQLAMLLNTMVMISGGDNYLLGVPPPGADKTQGCVVIAAYVPPAIIGIFFAAAGLLAGVVLAYGVAAVQLKHSMGRQPVKKAEIETVPQSVEEWAMLAAREHEVRITATELKQFRVGFSQGDGGRVRIFRDLQDRNVALA